MTHFQTKEWRLQELQKWRRGIYYRQIRGAESPLPALTEEGKRLRGLTLAPNLYLARDKNFYEVRHGVAHRLDEARVLETYTISRIRELFRIAIKTGA